MNGDFTISELITQIGKLNVLEVASTAAIWYLIGSVISILLSLGLLYILKKKWGV